MTARVATVAPGIDVEPVPLAGPPIALSLRAAVWAEAAVLTAAARALDAHGPGAHRDVPVEVVGPTGGRAVARCRPDDSIEVAVEAGEVLDEVVLRSYCIGAAHQALGWVRSEGIAVDAEGDGAGPDDALVRHPAGPGHAAGQGGVDPAADGAGRSTAPTRCSPRWPRPGGWPTGWSGPGRSTARAPGGAEWGSGRTGTGLG